jgi:hypothetical protein
MSEREIESIVGNSVATQIGGRELSYFKERLSHLFQMVE